MDKPVEMTGWRIGMASDHNASMIFDPNDTAICSVFGVRLHAALDELGESDAEGLRVAHLITAAPDLLTALMAAECAVQELCNDQDPANQCWATLGEIRAAIFKARGEQL